jgi:outer membrane receptor for ferric coprogen and ferric-rhodotorulic acid
LILRQLWAVLFCLLTTSFAYAAPEGSPPNASALFGLQIRADLPLDEALQELARQTGAQLVFFSQVTAGRSAPALSGKFTMAAALTRLLEGSGLMFRQVNERTFQVQPGPAPPAASQGAARRPGNARRSTAAAASADGLEEVHVIATAEQLVATRIPTPLREIPQSISIISPEQIRQQNSFELGDVLRNAPGIATRRGDSLDETGYSRSFEVTSYHVDGGSAVRPIGRDGGSIYASALDLGEFDHVEVLRGSDALFTGNSYPGGTVSVVRKHPLPTPALNVSATLGSWSNRRIEVDVNRPLVDDGSLRARVDAVYADRDFFFDRAHLERKKIFAVFEYDFTPTATLTAGGGHQRDDSLPLTKGWPLYSDGSDSRLPRNTALAFDWAYYNTRQSEVYLQYRQRFAGDWTIKLNASAMRATVDAGIGDFPTRLDRKTLFVGVPSASFNLYPDHHRMRAADATLTGVLDWFGVREEIAIGGDYTRVRSRQAAEFYGAFGPPLVDPRTFDPGNYSNPRGTRPADLGVESRGTVEQYGGFISLRVELNAAWSVTAGARISSDSYHVAGKLWSETLVFPGLTNQSGSSHVITPYGALMYRINDHFSWYTSYADVYLSQTGHKVRADELPIGPTHGVNLESGVKGVWRDGALNASLAVYQIAQRHVAVEVESVPGPVPGPMCCFVSGTGYSRGAEMQVDGEGAPGWLIGGGYTYNNNQTADGGIPITATPRHLFKIWTSTTLPGPYSQWMVGGSLRAQTVPRGNLLFDCDLQLQNCVPREVRGLKPYAVLDLRAGFDVNRNWQVALSLNNAFDKRYYLSHNSPSQDVWYGEPRNFMLRIDAKY